MKERLTMELYGYLAMKALHGLYVAVPGAALRGIVVRRLATGTIAASRTTASVFASSAPLRGSP